MDLRADGPPGRWKKKNIRNKKKQREITSGREQGRADGREQGRADGREQTAGQGADGRADGSKCGMIHIATFIFHWKLFPSHAVIRIKYQSKNNNINL